MTKRQIPVNGDKELIEKLNLNIKRIKSGEEPVIENTPKVEETELVPTEVCAPEEKVDFNKVESDLQREIKYRKDYRKTPENEVHAAAYPTVREMNVRSEEVKTLIDIFGPKMSELLSRINDAELDTTIDDNAACRETINKDFATQDDGQEVIPHKPSDEFKKILSISKNLAKYLKGIKVDGVVGENIRDVLTKAKSKTVKEACESVVSQQEPEQLGEPETVEASQEEKYEMVNHPAHYNNYDKEVIDIIERVWGTYLAAMWCEITAFKYRMRMGTKPTSSISEDLEKETWYLKKMKELKEKYNEGRGI